MQKQFHGPDKLKVAETSDTLDVDRASVVCDPQVPCAQQSGVAKESSGLQSSRIESMGEVNRKEK